MEGADRVVVGHHDDVIVLQVLNAVLEQLPGDHNVRLFTNLLVGFGVGHVRCRAQLFDCPSISTHDYPPYFQQLIEKTSYLLQHSAPATGLANILLNLFELLPVPGTYKESTTSAIG